MEIVQAVKKLNSISRERLNFRRWPILCTTLYRNPIQASNFGGAFDQLSFEVFSHKMPLYFFYTMVQKKVKNDQKLKSRGSCLKKICGEKQVKAPGYRFVLTSFLSSCSHQVVRYLYVISGHAPRLIQTWEDPQSDALPPKCQKDAIILVEKNHSSVRQVIIQFAMVELTAWQHPVTAEQLMQCVK